MYNIPIQSNESATKNDFFGWVKSLGLSRPKDRVVGGVCAGLAKRFGWSKSVVRVITVLALFLIGFGAVIYALLWAFLPDEKTDEIPFEEVVVHGKNNGDFIGAVILFILSAGGSFFVTSIRFLWNFAFVALVVIVVLFLVNKLIAASNDKQTDSSKASSTKTAAEAMNQATAYAQTQAQEVVDNASEKVAENLKKAQENVQTAGWDHEKWRAEFDAKMEQKALWRKMRIPSWIGALCWGLFLIFIAGLCFVDAYTSNGDATLMVSAIGFIAFSFALAIIAIVASLFGKRLGGAIFSLMLVVILSTGSLAGLLPIKHVILDYCKIDYKGIGFQMQCGDKTHDLIDKIFEDIKGSTKW